MSNNKSEVLRSLSSDQCRTARAMLRWSQEHLAAASGVSRATIADFERNQHQPIPANLDALRSAFERTGLVFIPENGGGWGLRFRDRQAEPK